jgi:hypothetical protein
VDTASLLASCLRLAHFDIDKVLSHGAELLGSQGSEYDIQDITGLLLQFTFLALL